MTQSAYAFCWAFCWEGGGRRMGCQAPTGEPRAWPVWVWTPWQEGPPWQGWARLWLNEEMPRGGEGAVDLKGWL